MPTVYIKRGRVKPLLYRHPWVFADSVERVEGDVRSGEVVDVRAPDGRFLARGFYSDRSALRVRSFAFDEAAEADPAWVRRRIEEAVAMRREVLGLPDEATTCYRAVHGDADGLPGLVVDVLGDVVSLQVTSAGLEARREAVLDAIEAVLAPRAIVESPDERTREREGLGPVAPLQRGELPAGGVAVVAERGIAFEVDLLGGQKTGFFCDQRENRARVAELSKGRRVLDAFCYTGGFALAAARAGAERVDAIDSSGRAIDALRRNADRNGLVVGASKADAFKELARFRAEGRRFDLCVLDPPKYARTRRDLPKALRKYKELFALGADVTSPGGVLVLCSCSGHVDDAAFQGLLGEVVRATGRHLCVFHVGGQAPDHPVNAACPEGRYLRASFCHVR